MTLDELIANLDEPHRTIAKETADALRGRFGKKQDLIRSRTETNRRRRIYNARLKEQCLKECSSEYSAMKRYRKEKREILGEESTINKRGREIIKRLNEGRAKLTGYGIKSRLSMAELPDAKTPESWREDVAKISNPLVRSAVASIVWWDFFGIRNRLDGRKYWDHLDEFLNDWKPGATEIEIANGLIACGYTPYDAVMGTLGGDRL